MAPSRLCCAVTRLIDIKTHLKEKGLVPPYSPLGQGDAFSPKTGSHLRCSEWYTGTDSTGPAPSSSTQPEASPAISRCPLRPSDHTLSVTRNCDRNGTRGAHGCCRRVPHSERPLPIPRAGSSKLFVLLLFLCCVIVPFRSFLKASSIPASLRANATPSRVKLSKL